MVKFGRGRLPYSRCVQVLLLLLCGLLFIRFLFQESSQSGSGGQDDAIITISEYSGGSGGADKGNPKPACVELDVKYVEDNYYSLDQKDPQLIQYTRMRYLTPPSKLEYNMPPKQKATRTDHNNWVMSFFGNKKNGIFIEAGANDGGGDHSHTLYLERELGWTGLLVECNPKLIPALKSRHRKAWIGNVCLAPTTTPGVLNFSNPINWTYSGTFNKPWELPLKYRTPWEFFEVETMPLYTLLAGLGWKEIDFFLFDIEGSELSVLKNFPFDEIIFKVLIMEINFYKEEELEELRKLMTSNGYHLVKKMEYDHVYVHKSVKHMVPIFTWPF